VIQRNDIVAQVEKAIKRSQVTAILGPRQCGKTTLARVIAKKSTDVHFFDLEDPLIQAQLQNPQLILTSLKGLIILDEIQLKPELFSLLRVLSDRTPLPARFLILGSASPDIIRHTSESLAGRIEFIEMQGLNLGETRDYSLQDLWLRGGMPRSFLADSEDDSMAWRNDFIRTFLERDIMQLGYRLASMTMRRLWHMIAHYHGQVWNASAVGNALGLNHKTVNHYLDVLVGTYTVKIIQPWYENIKKRQIKSPRVYIQDSGMLHALLGLSNFTELTQHPKCGASWEGFVIMQILSQKKVGDSFFWSTYQGAEVDLLLKQGQKKIGIECKLADAPKLTKSMVTALETLNLSHLYVVYPGEIRYPLHEKITVVGLPEVIALNL